MKTAEVICRLKARGVELWQERGALRYRAPAGALTDRDKAALRAHKNAILRALEPLPTQPTAIPGNAAVTPALAATEPAGPCPTCGSNRFWRALDGWQCWGCTELPPMATTLCIPAANPPNSPDPTGQPAAHCHGCTRWRPEKAGCADRPGVIRNPAQPPCAGADFAPKETRP